MTVETKVIPISLQVRPRDSDKAECQKGPLLCDIRPIKRHRLTRDAKPRLASKLTRGQQAVIHIREGPISAQWDIFRSTLQSSNVGQE